ncbi:MAG: hypothetical protein AMXMBFR16_11580 [Candidatus Uhrbacteria bacterium]
MKREIPPERLATLERLSGLTVRGYVQTGVNYFQFMEGDETVKTVCTYSKARIFAMGIAIGKRLWSSAL